jgi:hypothetical protein
MAAPITEKFEQLVLEVETDTPGTYAIVCGLTDITISRTAELDTTEVPADCTDESLPLRMEKSIRAINVSVSASGVWAQQSNDMLLAWFYGGATKNVRIKNENAAVGDIHIEAGAALLTKVDHARTKGQKVTAEIELEFDGTPTRTDKAA